MLKKEEVAGLIVYLLILAVAIVYGLAVLQPYFVKSTFSAGIVYALFILGAVVVGIVSSALFCEVGHIIGAKTGGYTILSINVLHLCLVKEDDKFKFKFANFDGLTGETKILPKSEKSKPKGYLMFGIVMNAIWLSVAIVIFILNKDIPTTGPSWKVNWAYFFLTVGVTVGICLFYNILPLKLDSVTDGYRLTMVSNPKNVEAFNELLRVEYEISQGNNDVEIKTFTDLTNFTAELNMNKVYLLLDKEEYKEADELLDIVLKSKGNVSNRVYLRAIGLKIYIHSINSDLEAAKKYIEENVTMELRRDIFDESSLISIRAYLLVCGIVDNSKSEAVLSLNKTYNAYRRVSKNRRKSELIMFNKALDLVSSIHPKWEIENYRLIDDTISKKDENKETATEKIKEENNE